jgi:2-C-methyl-D-erythritol 2,4-cyclodiphosphate synthase
MVARSGIGYDAHVFAEDRPLVLAGVRLRSRRGLLGHSDADVVCHAVCDALLGAIAAGDIGQHFPDSDPQYARVSSLSLLGRVSNLVREAGWDIENVDAVVIAEQPRIDPYIADMRHALAGAMATEIERVNVKATTTEGMGFTGRGEGIASQAVALLRPGASELSRATTKEQTCRSTSLPKE